MMGISGVHGRSVPLCLSEMMSSALLSFPLRDLNRRKRGTDRDEKLEIFFKRGKQNNNQK